MSCGSGAVVTINGVTSTNKIQILIKNRSGFSKSVIFKFEDGSNIMITCTDFTDLYINKLDKTYT